MGYAKFAENLLFVLTEILRMLASLPLLVVYFALLWDLLKRKHFFFMCETATALEEQQQQCDEDDDDVVVVVAALNVVVVFVGQSVKRFASYYILLLMLRWFGHCRPEFQSLSLSSSHVCVHVCM